MVPLFTCWQGVESGNKEVDEVPRVKVGETIDKVENLVEESELVVESEGEGIVKSRLITGSASIEIKTKRMHIAAPQSEKEY